MSAGAPGASTPRSGRRMHGRRDRRRRPQHVGQVDAEPVQVAHRVDHRQRRARELPLRPAHDAAGRLDRAPAEHELPVAHARRGRRVGDQREAVRRRLPGDRHGVGRDVVQVHDHLHDDIGARERGDRDARIARRALAHRVEEVRDGRDTAVEGQVRLGGGRVGMPGRDGDPARDQLVDQLERAAQLRRQRDLRDRRRIEQPAQQRDVRSAQARACRARRRGAATGTALRRALRARAGRSRRAASRAAPRAVRPRARSRTSGGTRSSRCSAAPPPPARTRRGRRPSGRRRRTR